MSTERRTERATIAFGGALLLSSLTLDWGGASDAPRTLSALTGLIALLAAATGGRIGLFRPDVSFNGAADLFGVATCVVLLFDLGALDTGGLVALAGAAVVAGGAGDWSPLRGAAAFPRL